MVHVGGSRNSRVCGDNSVALSSIVVRIETGTDSEKKKSGSWITYWMNQFYYNDVFCFRFYILFFFLDIDPVNELVKINHHKNSWGLTGFQLEMSLGV